MNLEEIRDIVRLFDDYKQLNILPLDLKSLRSGNSKPAQFFRILTETALESDEDASYAIYGNTSTSNYKFLKSYFTSRALNNLAFLDLKGGGISEKTQAAYKSYKNLSHIEILIRLGRRHGAIALAKKTLPLARRYELYLVEIGVLEQLRAHSLQTGNKKEFTKFSDELHRAFGLLENQTTIETLVNRVRINFTKTSYIDEKYKPEALQALQKVRKLLINNDTYLSRVSFYRLLYTYRQLEGFPSKSISVCDEAIEYLKSMPHMASRPNIGEFSLYKLENYLLLRNFEKGIEVVSDSEKYFKTGTNNWFRFKEQQFLLLMQSLRFDEAYAIFYEAISDKRYVALILQLKERWEIFRFYMVYITRGKQEKRRKIVPVKAYSKDKKGFHTAVLILNILQLLESGDKEGLIRQAETLSTYRFKYLSGKHSKQSFLLFKLIFIMINNEFDITRIRPKARRLERILAKTKPSRFEIFECIQIIPPEWMWKKMKVALATRASKTR